MNDQGARIFTRNGDTMDKRNLNSHIFGLMQVELEKAQSKHWPLNSLHEGFAVLKEEVDELWDEVKKQTDQRDPANVLKEALQVGAMAARIISDTLESAVLPSMIDFDIQPEASQVNPAGVISVEDLEDQLRDEFAKAAMASIFTGPGAQMVAGRDETYDETNWAEVVAANAYDMAEAMLVVRRNRKHRRDWTKPRESFGVGAVVLPPVPAALSDNPQKAIEDRFAK